MEQKQRESKIRVRSIGKIIIGLIMIISVIFMIYLAYSLLNMKDSDNTISDNIDNPHEQESITEEPGLEDFTRLEEYFIDYAFELSYDDDEDYFDIIYQVDGSYDLNGDGQKDNISAVLKPRDNSSYIEVNGIAAAFHPDHPTGEVYLIDLDSRDSYIELAVYDEGPSYDPLFEFFRYDGKELFRIGAIDAPAYTDGQGKFITRSFMSLRFEPMLYSAWEELRDNEFVKHNHDIEQYIGKEYKLNGIGYFVPKEENPKDYYEYVTWDDTALREFINEKVKLLDIRSMSDYYVELQNGEKGLLYFWVGD